MSTTYNPYTATTTPAYVAQYAHTASVPTTALPYFPALTQHSQALYASLSQQHSASTDHHSHHPPEQLPPDLTSITQLGASRLLRRLIVHELRRAGFDSAHRTALDAIEHQLITCMFHPPRPLSSPELSEPVITQLFERTHGYANLANRAGPIAPDLLLACQDFRIPLKDLQTLKQKTSKKKQCLYFRSSHALSA